MSLFVLQVSVGPSIDWNTTCTRQREREVKMGDQVFTFASSPFVPVAIGFFGLGTGYFIWGGQALFGFPKSSPGVNRTLGLWDGWMDMAFLLLSILGADVFRRTGDIPVMLIFVGLTLIYAIEIPTRLLSWTPGGRLVGLFQFITVIWLVHSTYATSVDLALGAKAWV